MQDKTNERPIKLNIINNRKFYMKINQSDCPDKARRGHKRDPWQKLNFETAQLNDFTGDLATMKGS